MTLRLVSLGSHLSSLRRICKMKKQDEVMSFTCLTIVILLSKMMLRFLTWSVEVGVGSRSVDHQEKSYGELLNNRTSVLSELRFRQFCLFATFDVQLVKLVLVVCFLSVRERMS